MHSNAFGRGLVPVAAFIHNRVKEGEFPMNMLLKLSNWHAGIARALDRLQPLLLLATRFYVGWQFTKSGWLKVTSWETTLGLFRDEYHVPLLPPDLAALARAGAEAVQAAQPDACELAAGLWASGGREGAVGGTLRARRPAGSTARGAANGRSSAPPGHRTRGR
jgi:hypothetical protein